MKHIADNFRLLMHEHFQAELVDFRIEVDSGARHINSRVGSFVQQMSPTSYILKFSTIESKLKRLDIASNIRSTPNMIRDGSLDPLLEGTGIVASYNIRIDNSIIMTDFVIFLTNLEKFSKNLNDFTWKKYSVEFDSILEKTLAD